MVFTLKTIKKSVKKIRFELYDKYLSVKNAPVLHCIGDSHLNLFIYLKNYLCLKHTRLKFCMVPGATASGLLNPNSMTQSRSAFLDYSKKNITSDDNVLFCLGEVDCGFLIWYYMKQKNISINNQLKNTVVRYISFLKDFSMQFTEKLVIFSVPLPTIEHYDLSTDIYKLRHSVNTSITERTELTMNFNSKLKQMCHKNGWTYLDLEQYIIDSETNLISPKYIHDDPRNHHLNPTKVSTPLIYALGEKGFF